MSCPPLEVFPELEGGRGRRRGGRRTGWAVLTALCSWVSVLDPSWESMSLDSCFPLPALLLPSSPLVLLWRQPWGQCQPGLCRSWATAEREPGKQCRSRSQADLSMAFFFFSPPWVLIVVTRVKCCCKINILVLCIYFPPWSFNVKFTQQTSQNKIIFFSNCCCGKSQPGISENHCVPST